MTTRVRVSTIREVQEDIEESLASLHGLELPPELQGLRHLPTGDHDPQVSIRRADSKRKVREDAAASYFDPDTCEVVISFVPFEAPVGEDEASHSAEIASGIPSSEFDFAEATDQLIDQITQAEEMRPFVGLKWFRDQFLPQSGYEWARDPRLRSSLLRYATNQRLVLTSHVPNPNQPLHPVTAIRVNRRHSRFQSEAPRRTGFRPIPIRGGPISDTVLSDRR